MIRIGDFSKLSRVPVKTLRYYDEIGLLKPVEVDRFTSYRYYAYAQLARLNRILALKDLGFSLEDIRELLEQDMSTEQLRGMFKLREAESRQTVREEAQRLARIEARLKLIEQEDVMSTYDVVIKKIDALQVASLRGVVPTPPEQGGLWHKLEGHLATENVRGIGPCLSLYHDEDYRERDWDIEVCEPIAGEISLDEHVEVKTLPAVENMACVIHKGPFTTIGEAYQAIIRWLDENGYQTVGPVREIYLKTPRNGSQTDPETVTEVQFPVEKN